ncbi:hypothetical protein ABVK25_009903 [Lepraria finkii]|uniref:BSD domain-containing protein n=1 Tax=Lepraria finkii TaxID=1340010 RepID=A0ABR4B235_9LECA
MDVAYDHIQEEALSPDEVARKEADEKQEQGNLNTEIQEAYKSFSASPWGAKLGGFLSDVKKQGMPYYEGAKQQGSAASGEALKGFSDLRSTLVNRARSISTGQGQSATSNAGAWDDDTADDIREEVKGEEEGNDKHKDKERTESEALQDSEGVISRFRAEATKRLKDLEKAEEAADAAIFKFGANIGGFLRDAVTIAPPTEETNKDGSRKILFESKDQDGKRVIHTTRFDAQLHAIHSSLESFTKDPVSPEYEKWKTEFDAEKKPDAIATDLEKYQELRRTMEKLVPEKVEYPVFWTRYYFLRMVVETEEQRRREMLKDAANEPAETIGWGDDSDDEESSTPQQRPVSAATIQASDIPTASQSSSTTIRKPSEATPESSSLKPNESRRSEEGSDASYDLVSGATSRAPGSPKETKGKGNDDDEEEEWE